MDEAIRLYFDEKWSMPEIAKKFGLSTNSFYDLFENRKLKLRPNNKSGGPNPFERGGWLHDRNAISQVNQAVKSGRLKRPKTCSECGKSKVRKNGQSDIHGHHNDYNKPLEVRWLCKTCHHAWHEINKAIPRQP